MTSIISLGLLTNLLKESRKDYQVSINLVLKCKWIGLFDFSSCICMWTYI